MNLSPPHGISGSSARARNEDVELVRLARDTVTFAALSRGSMRPTLGEDGRGSLGYDRFLGRYAQTPGVVFTRISKRERRDGQWQNRNRGCECVGLFDPNNRSFAERTIESALVSATRARRVHGSGARMHKPIWPAEIGSLSLFVFVVERMIDTRSTTAAALINEGHDVRNDGIMVFGTTRRATLTASLPSITTVEQQLSTAIDKMHGFTAGGPRERVMRIVRMRGRWLWEPSRPLEEFF